MHGVITLLHVQGLPHILRPISAPIEQSHNLKSGAAREGFRSFGLEDVSEQ